MKRLDKLNDGMHPLLLRDNKKGLFLDPFLNVLKVFIKDLTFQLSAFSQDFIFMDARKRGSKD